MPRAAKNAWEPVRFALFIAACASGTASALLASAPVWFAISLAGPHNPSLWAPMAAAAALKLGLELCLLIREALEDGKLEGHEIVGVTLSLLTKTIVTANALLPQPVFTTILGGSFTSGDAARAGHLRLSRWLWRATAGTSFFVAVAIALALWALGRLVLAKLHGHPGLVPVHK